MTLSIQETSEGIRFRIHVQPRASSNRISGLHGDALKLHLTAPPVDNAANKMVIAFLAKTLNVPKSTLEIVSGHTSRMKQVLFRSSSLPEKTRFRDALRPFVDG